jgi:hypothetical protein
MSGDANPKILQIGKDDPDWDAAHVAKDFRPARGKVLDSWNAVLGYKHPP